MAARQDLTEILRMVSAGNREALDELLPLVYAELRSRALDLMRRERPDHTLQATALVHEAYLKLVDQRQAQWRDRLHFFAAAAGVMRRILTDHAKHHRRKKRGGGYRRLPLDDVHATEGNDEDIDIAALDEALVKLEAIDEQRARIVEMRYFGGLTVEQVATVLEVPRRTVDRRWRSARMWLHRELSTGNTG